MGFVGLGEGPNMVGIEIMATVVRRYSSRVV